MQKNSSRSNLVVSPAQVAAFRLQRHHLRDFSSVDAVSICSDICGVQAQMMQAAYLQFWTRNHDLTRRHIEDALWNRHVLVKTSLMRQTIHIIPTTEFPVYISALKASRVAQALRVMARFKIGPDEGHFLTGLILEALSGGPLGRAAIRNAIRPRVSKRVRAWMEAVWSIMRIPVADGLVCYGPGEGNEINFIRVDQWLGHIKTIPPMEAQAILLRKYLRAYGPASVRDFAHWAGIPMKESREAYGCIQEERMTVKVSKQDCDILKDDADEIGAVKLSRGVARLLPLFDPFLLAHAEKTHLLQALHYKRVYRNQGWISAVILVDGKIVGTWAYRFERNTIIVELQPFASLQRAVRSSLSKEAAALARFFGKDLKLKFSD